MGIVGGGIVGLAVARELARRRPGARVVVLEKEDRVAAHQTGHNSGVVHAGIYYRPGSLKAELCTRGRQLLRDYCAERGLPYDECGKLVVAVDPPSWRGFDALERTARRNDVPGLRRIDGAEDRRDRAAHRRCRRAALAGDRDHRLRRGCRGLAAEIRAPGERCCFTRGDRHRAARRRDRRRCGTARHRGRPAGRLRRPAGRPGRRAGGGSDGPRIVPFRGEYLTVVPSEAGPRPRHGLPGPRPALPVPRRALHARVDGALEVGPNAFLALEREGYGRRSASRWATCADLRVAGLLAVRADRTGAPASPRSRGSLSVRAYLATAQRYVPEIGPRTSSAAARDPRAGRRARRQRSSTTSDPAEDGITSVRNAPSPAATSSLAIAEHVVDRIEQAVAGVSRSMA